MKTLDWVKKNVEEFPADCTHITVDDSGEIWINEGDVSKSSFFNGAWSSNYSDSIECEIINQTLEDNSHPILKEDFDGVVTKLTTNHYVDVQGWSEDKIKKAAEMFSEHVGKPIWDDCDALTNEIGYTFLAASNEDVWVMCSSNVEDKVEISQDNFNQLLEEWEMQKQHIWEDGDVATIQSNVRDTHCFEEGQEVILIDAQTTNVNKPAAICKAVDSLNEWWVLHENLSPKSCEITHRTNGGDNSIDNITVVEAPTSDDKASLVQRITLAHKAALQACQEAVEAYNTYKNAVDELKEDVGDGFKIEEVKWEDMFTSSEVTFEELSPEEW